MNLAWYLSLILFTVSTCGTPGPNNIMILASGMNHGIRRSVPHVVGINIGFPLMVLVLGMGLDGVFRAFPAIYNVLRPIGVVYLLYLAYRIAVSPTTIGDTASSRPPLTVPEAALFQLSNPKAWVMAIGALITYVSSGSPAWIQVTAIAAVFFVFGTPCTVAWMLIGASIKRVLRSPRHFRVFNLTMAGLLVVSVLPVVREVYSSLTG